MVLLSGSAVDKEFANYGIGACDVSMFKCVLIIIMYFHTEISLQCPFCHQCSPVKVPKINEGARILLWSKVSLCLLMSHKLCYFLLRL